MLLLGYRKLILPSRRGSECYVTHIYFYSSISVIMAMSSQEPAHLPRLAVNEAKRPTVQPWIHLVAGA